ncbi:MAG: hypothetical protein JNM26_16885, partial [Ideonella sp.]|nr:hypothetical protein [Ideonella sp.]
KGETVADACCELRLRGVDRIGHVVGLMEAPVSKALAATFPSARSWLSAAAFGDVSGSSAVGQSSEGLPSARLRRQVLAASVVVDELERVFCRALEQGGLEDEQQVMALLKGELLRIERRAALRSGRRRASLSPRAVVAPAAH